MSATKTWTGNAQAVAQVETWAPGTQPRGTTATATINGKSASYTSASGTNDDLISGLIAAIGKLGTTAPEFNEVSFVATAYSPAAAAPNSTYLLMTAKSAGTPFTISISLAVPPRVVIARLAAGAAGVNELQQITISPNAESGSAFTVQFGSSLSGQVPTPPSPPTFNAFVASGALTGNYHYVVTFGTALGETEPSAASAQIAPAAQNVTINLPLGPADCTYRRVYRTLAGGTVYYLVGTVADNVTATYTDSSTDTTISANAAPPVTNGCLQGALEALVGVGQGNVKVFGAGVAAVSGQSMPTSPIVYTVQFVGTLAAAPQQLLIAVPDPITILPTITVTETVAGYPAQNEIQVIGWKQVHGLTAPSGSFTITLPGLGVTTAPILSNASAASVLAAIQAVVPVAYINSFTVAAGPASPTTQPQLQGLWQITYQGLLANTDVPQATVDVSKMSAASGDTISAYLSTTQPGSSTGRNEIVSVVTSNNGPTGGTWGLTGTLANGNKILATGLGYNASAVTLQNAFPAGTVSVTGSGTAAAPYIVEAMGEAGTQKVSFAATSSLTGGTFVAGTVPSTNTAGVDPPSGLSATPGTTDGSLASGTYYYAVTAVNGNGETKATEVAANVTGPDGTVTLGWNAVPTATSYNVYRGLAPGNENVKLAANITGRVYLDAGGLNQGAALPTFNSTYTGVPTNLSISTFENTSGGPYKSSLAAATYYYKVTATNSLGESAASAEVSATVAAGQGVSLAWNPVNGASGYKVYRGTSAAGENTLIATLTASGTAAGSPTYLDCGPPDTSVSPPTTGSVNSLVLHAGDLGTVGFPPLANNGAIEWGALAPGTYYYKLTYVNANGETLPANEVSVTVNSLGQMPAIYWTWNGEYGNPPDATTIKIYRGTTLGGENTLIASYPASHTDDTFYDLGGTTTAATPPGSDTTGIAAPTQNAPTISSADGNFSAGTYYYKITATTAGGETTPSGEQSAPLTAGELVTLNWTAVTHATGYKIYRGTSAGAENVLVGVVNDGAATAFSDSGPANTSASPPTVNGALIAAPTQNAPSTSASGGNLASATYYYKVTAYTRAGETTGSNEQSIAVTGPTGQVTINWSADSGADGYRIYRGTAAGQENALAGTSTSTSFVDYGNASATIAVTELSAGRGASNEVQSITILGATGGTFALAFEGAGSGNMPYNDTASDVATQLQAVSTIGANNIAVAGPAGGPFIATFAGTLGGEPQPLLAANPTNLTGSMTYPQSVTLVTASTGPNNWDNPANWSPAGVPATGDTAVFQNSSVDCLYGLAQSAVTLANLQVDMSFVGGWIGLPNWNSNKYSEYRQQYLQIGVSGQIIIGNGKGSGPTLIKLDTGTSAVKMLVNGCGQNQDPTLPAILWKGNRVSGSTELDVYKGRVGIAMFAGETATVDTIRQGFLTNKNSDSYVFVGQGVTLTNWYKDGGDGVLNTPVATLLRHELGTLTVLDGLVVTTVGTLNLVGGTLTDRATGTITTLTVGTGAIYDRTDDSRVKTITNTTIYGKSSFLDPHGSITFTNPYTLANCGYPDLVAFDVGTNITGQRVQL